MSVEVGPNARSCVEGAVGNAWNAALYREPAGAEPGLSFAAHLLFYLAKDHCSVDGNKRVAWLSALDVLLALRLTLEASTDEAEELVLGIASGETDSVDPVAHWFAEHLTWVD